MRTKFTVDAEVLTTSGEWKTVRFEQISTTEKLARRRVSERAIAAGFVRVANQKTIAKAHAL